MIVFNVNRFTHNNKRFCVYHYGASLFDRAIGVADLLVKPDKFPRGHSWRQDMRSSSCKYATIQ